jgi:branched-chain amino acid transport system ATP-binding protein
VDLLKTTQLTKYFGDTHAVDHVDFTVAAGEVLALIGSNGAGKTTLINLISGLIAPDSGRVDFQGADITRASTHRKIGLGIARSFQLVNLFDQLSVQDNVTLAIFSREGRTRRLFSLADADTAVRDEGATVLKQFGELIRAKVDQVLARHGVEAGEVRITDRGALDYAIEARLETAILRATEE